MASPSGSDAVAENACVVSVEIPEAGVTVAAVITGGRFAGGLTVWDGGGVGVGVGDGDNGVDGVDSPPQPLLPNEATHIATQIAKLRIVPPVFARGQVVRPDERRRAQWITGDRRRTNDPLT